MVIPHFGKYFANPLSFELAADGSSTAEIKYNRDIYWLDPNAVMPPGYDPDNPDPRLEPQTEQWNNNYPVAWEDSVTFVPDEEEYIYADALDPIFPESGTKDAPVEVPILYFEKLYTVVYKVNDAALGSVSSEGEQYAIISGEPEGSTANTINGSIFANWTDENNEFASGEAFFCPEKYTVDEPEFAAVLRDANVGDDNPDHIYDGTFYTANFDVAPSPAVTQTGDTTNWY